MYFFQLLVFNFHIQIEVFALESFSMQGVGIEFLGIVILALVLWKINCPTPPKGGEVHISMFYQVFNGKLWPSSNTPTFFSM